MRITVHPNANGFGAAITGVRLAGPLDPEQIAEIRQAWLHHQVIWFPEQPMPHSALEMFTRAIGPFGEDPYVKPLNDHPNILEIRREPDESVAPFGSNWHSDWSFQKTPPSATVLHAKVVPPIGGNTLYADGCAAYDALTPSEQQELEQLTALHSARRPYSIEGFMAGGGPERSMKIVPDATAYAIQEHPLIRVHPETGRKVLWVNSVYTIGIRGMRDDEALTLIAQLCEFATSERFLYRHVWQENMLTVWDNRSVQHCALGGYDGYRRVMHRTTVAGDKPFGTKRSQT